MNDNGIAIVIWKHFNRISPYSGVDYKFNDLVALDARYQCSFYIKK